MAFAFSLILYPHRYRLALRLIFPEGAIRVYRVPLVCQSGLGPLYPPAIVCPRQGRFESLCRSRTILVQAYQHLWLAVSDDGSPRVHIC
jgi:hypothetical protein